MKSKASKLAKLKKKADCTFSRYIRLKNSVAGYCTCVTCGKKLPIKGIQNGHYIPRNILITRFSEDNCHPQCVGCNVFKSGNLGEYAHYILKTYGEEKLDELHQLKHQIVKFKVYDYEQMIGKWKEEIEDMQVGLEIQNRFDN